MLCFFLWRSLEIRILGQVHEFSRILYFLLTKKPPPPRIKFIIFPHTVRYIPFFFFSRERGDKKLTICEGKMPCVCLDSNLSRFITRDWRHFFPLPLLYKGKRATEPGNKYKKAFCEGGNKWMGTNFRAHFSPPFLFPSPICINPFPRFRTGHLSLSVSYKNEHFLFYILMFCFAGFVKVKVSVFFFGGIFCIGLAPRIILPTTLLLLYQKRHLVSHAIEKKRKKGRIFPSEVTKGKGN